MKTVAFVLTVLALSSAAMADTYVNGYTKSNGTYVEGYHRTSSDASQLNNYSTQGNSNPYTGSQGTVNPYNTGSSNTGNTYGNSNGRQLGYGSAYGR